MVRTRTSMYATIEGEMTPEPQPAGIASSVRTTCADLVFFMSARMVGSWPSRSAASASVSARIHTGQRRSGSVSGARMGVTRETHAGRPSGGYTTRRASAPS